MDRTSLNSFNILGMIKVQQGRSFFVITYSEIGRKRFISMFYFCGTVFRFLVSPPAGASYSGHPVEKGISDGVYFNKVASLHCTDCSSMIYRLYHIYLWSMLWKLAVLKRIF